MHTKQRYHTGRQPVDVKSTEQNGFIILLALLLLIGVGFIGAIAYIILLG